MGRINSSYGTLAQVPSRGTLQQNSQIQVVHSDWRKHRNQAKRHKGRKERTIMAKNTRGRRKTKARGQEAQQQQRRSGLCNKWEGKQHTKEKNWQKLKEERGTEGEDEEGNRTNQCETQGPLLRKLHSQQAGQQPRREGGDEGETQGRRKEAKGEANTKHVTSKPNTRTWKRAREMEQGCLGNQAILPVLCFALLLCNVIIDFLWWGW
jgi:hypothetical protein